MGQISTDKRASRDDQDLDSRERIKQTFSGDSCEDLIENKERGEELKCEEMCKEIYGGSRKECEELPEDAIAKIHELHEILENPDEDDLAEVEPVVFESYLDINVRPFSFSIEEYNKKEAEETLVWILSDYEVFEFFEDEDEDEDFELLKELLGKFSDEGNLAEVFAKKIANEDSLMEYLMKLGEEVFDYLVFDYVKSESRSCEDRESKNCFRIYCQIGKELEEEVRADMINNSTEFYDYIDDIIDGKVNSNKWEKVDNETVVEVADVESNRKGETWVDLLCKGL